MKELFQVTAAALLLMQTSALGQDFEKGESAAEAGDFKTALQEFQPLAEQGHSDAQDSLGYMYKNGFGVSKDYIQAAKWFRRASEQGHARAQFRLASMYNNGQGVSQDFVLSFMWFSVAAKNGLENALVSSDGVASEMTDEQIAEAQHLAKVCMDSNYTECG